MIKKIGVYLLVLGLIFLTTACGNTERLDNTSINAKNSQNVTEDSAIKDEKNDKSQKDSGKDKEEEEYYDVTSAADDKEDYSKYNEKTQNGQSVTYSDGTEADVDEYNTNPVPEGMQNPVEPEDVEIDTNKKETCYLSVSCATILDNMENLTEGKEVLVPSDGIIYSQREVSFYAGESVFDVLLREMQNNRIHMEYNFTPMYNSNYIQGIGNLYEHDCGGDSGWMFSVNGWYPNYGCSRYIVQEGDIIEWNYTCDLGRDLGQTWIR